MTGKARAIVFSGPGQPLQLHEYELPKLKPGEILVRVECSTLCGADLHSYQGHRSTPCPTVLGHEIMGRVAELPAGESLRDSTGRELHIGDRITWSVAGSCGSCFFCNNELPQKCESLFKYGHERITEDHPLSGGLGDYCHLARGTAVFPIPDELPMKVACPVNCATATVAGAMRYAGDCTDRVVLVLGAGMLGLTTAAMAGSLGAREVIICDINPDRLRLAERFGATRTALVTDDSKELRQTVLDTTSGRGVDIALEMSGTADATELGLDLLRIGGNYVWIGATFPSRSLTMTAETVVRRILSIHGLHNYIPEDLATALEFLRRYHTQFPFEDLVSGVFKLEDTEAAFTHAIQTGALRVAIQG